MTRTRIALISTTALATMLGAALPALAQAPVPAPMYAPAPPPAPMMAPAPMPMPEAAPVMPVAPMVAAPRAADDMTGSVGFRIGVGASIGGTGTATGTSTATSLVTADTTRVAMKYYLSDAMAIMPDLVLKVSKTKDADAVWSFNPSVLAMFNLLKGASTRFDGGVGLGLQIGKTPPADTSFGLNIPVALNVEHFFTRWFSMGLGTKFDLINFYKPGDSWTMKFEVSNVNYWGSLFFYTD
jgi:hypothetical protein